MVPLSFLLRAAEHIEGVLRHSIKHTEDRSALVVWDDESDLSRILVEAYRDCLPDAKFVQFETVTSEQIQEEFDALQPQDLVVLIQSTRFQLHAFRIRLELFKRSVKVIEHPHLGRMTGPEEILYLNSLEYDRDYLHTTGRALKNRLDHALKGHVDSGDGSVLHFPVGFEEAKLNIGDYSGMKNIGGQFPIGEVFTESKDLCAVYGSVRINFFGDTDFTVNRPGAPILLKVEKGRVVATEHSTPEFEEVLHRIKVDEGEVWVRELGFGLNRAFSEHKIVSDIGTFERMCGVHLSLGAKHASYPKPQIRKRSARHHVDVFVATQSVELDGVGVFYGGDWFSPD
ncbi:MAG: hypothetical protein MK213_08505 [Planctomycetes bacterium]|nr:hypothetical protein [Planctomycetota bacterium]